MFVPNPDGADQGTRGQSKLGTLQKLVDWSATTSSPTNRIHAENTGNALKASSITYGAYLINRLANGFGLAREVEDERLPA